MKEMHRDIFAMAIIIGLLASSLTISFERREGTGSVGCRTTALSSGQHGQSQATRFANRFVEDFDTMDLVDLGNTTAAVDTFQGRVLLSGAGGAGGSPAGHVSLANFNTAMGSIFINTMANFETHPIGQLQQNHYAGIGLISMTCTSGNVAHSAGPGQGNQGGAIQGEGPHQASRMLTSIRPNSAFTMDFNSGQSGVGFMVVDKFTGGNVILKGYSGPQGGGNLIATATAPNNNYQRNNMVFMGVTDGGVNSIRSVTWNIPNNGGDEVGIDDIRFGSTGIKSNLSYVQSKVVTETADAVGAARVFWYENKPQGTEIVYNLTADGKHWVRAQNGTKIIFEHIGAQLMWNATLTTDDPEITPYIDRIEIEYDLVDDPEPSAPPSDAWQGTPTPTLRWNFTDPDVGDHQLYYMVEIYEDAEMIVQAYNTTWTDSSQSKHTVAEPLSDGTYFWRVRTKDSMHAAGNWSMLKKMKIDFTKPIGSIVIEEGAHSVNENLVDIALNATDNGSGVADMRLINDQGTPGPWEAYGTEKGTALSNADGLKTIGVQFRDRAGIESDIYNDSIYLDLRGPGDMNISSPTHPDPEMYYNSTDPVFQWELPPEITGIKGYSYTFDEFFYYSATKVIYTQNGDATGTAPGDFTGLGDGSWYFHITPCDVYDQWGNDSHFRFNIDTTPPSVFDLTPDENEWFNTTTITATAQFSDTDGFGIDTDSIQYSVRKHGGTFSPWSSDGMDVEVIDRGIADNPEKVSASVEITVSEGAENGVRWRVADLSENGPVVSPVRNIRVDSTPVTFADPLPFADEVYTENTVMCGITILDTGGSGVDGKTVEYAISHWGDDVKLFQNWTPHVNPSVREQMEILGEMVFEPGHHNHIRWRARDAVGNGYAYSEPVLVFINSPPEPAIESPVEGWTFTKGEAITFNATGTLDPDADDLSYYWVVTNKTTKRKMATYQGSHAEGLANFTGPHVVTLYVNDGLGFNESEKVNILIGEKKGGGGTEDDDDDDGPAIISPFSKASEDGSLLWLILGIAALFLILIILVVLLVARRRRKKREEDDDRKKAAAMARVPPVHPYQQGYHAPHATQPYSQGPQAGGYRGDAYGGGPQYPYGGLAPTYPGASPGPLGLLALPPGPMGGQASYQGPAQAYPSTAQPAALPPMGGDTGIEGLYSLPSFTTEAGVQELGRLALPAAPAEDIMAQEATTAPQPEFPLDLTDSEPAMDPLEQLLSFDFSQPPGGVPEAMPGMQEPTVPLAAEPPVPYQDVPTGSAPGAALPPYPDVLGADAPAGPVPGPGPMPPPAPYPETPPAAPMPAPVPAPSPAPAPSPPTPPEAPAAPGPVVIECHSCGANYEVTDAQRPLVVQCPVCTAQGYLSQ